MVFPHQNFSALVTLTFVALGGCAIAHPYGADERANKPHPAAQADTAGAGDDNAANTIEAANLPDAGVARGPCAAQAATWTVGASSCTAMTGDLEEGATQALTDSTPDDTGSVTVTCGGGQLTYSLAVCEPPKEFDVDNPTGCGDGYCKGAVGGQCGVPDATKATAFCVFNHYAAYTTFKTGPGPNNARQCSADGTGCFTNANPTCNIILTSVTCRH
jgi:hypothetical protein